MAEVTIRQLRNHARQVLDGVTAGERVTITRGGKPVAELRPLHAPSVTGGTLPLRWRALPPFEASRFRRGIDGVIDASP